MKKFILLFAITGVLYYWYANDKSASPATYGEAHNELIMYSLTSCGFCKQKARELHAQNITFTEYFIDKDSDKMQELNEKLAGAGFKPKGYGTPIFDVHGVMLPNNPSMAKIKEHLQVN